MRPAEAQETWVTLAKILHAAAVILAFVARPTAALALLVGGAVLWDLLP